MLNEFTPVPLIITPTMFAVLPTKLLAVWLPNREVTLPEVVLISFATVA